MALFDFIGSGPNQLSLAEVLSALPAVAGPVLMQRGRKLGLPIGMGLTAFGALGQDLAKKEGAYNLGQQQMKALEGIDPRFKQIAPMAGLFPPQTVMEAFKALNPATKAEAPFPIFNPQTHEERVYNPASGQPIPQGFISSSFYKPEKEGTFQQEIDLFKKDPTTFRAVESAMHPGTTINAQMPTSPADFVHDKETNMWGYYTHDKAGNASFVPVSPTPPERLPTPDKPKELTRGTIKWKGNTYTTVKKPDGSMEATPSDTAPWFGPPLKKKLFFPPGSSTPIEIPLGAEIIKR